VSNHESLFLLGLALVFLLVLGGVFSAAETALTSASRAQMHQKAKRGDRRARIVNTLRQDGETLIGSLLLGNNLANTLGTALTTAVLTSLFSDAGVVYATAIMTVLILVFAEVLPKTYALSNAERMAIGLAPIVRGWLWLSWPLSWLLRRTSDGALWLFGLKAETPLGLYVSDEELRGAIELHASNPHREDVQHERAMLRSILDLDAVTVDKIMIHRKNMMAFDVNRPRKELIDEIIATPFTRIPLWEDEPGNIIGVLHVKALLRALRRTEQAETIDIRALAAEPWFIPDTANLLDQLQAFRERREHFAIVVDEYGTVMGVVTLEDILEEIVGEISDELDVPRTGIRREADGSFIVQGAFAVRDFNRDFDPNLPEEPAATIAGLVMHEARVLPEVGDVFSFHGFRFEILRRQRNQVTLIKMTPLAASDPTPA
jgi:Mg2+/Co2+ transporter CorB